MVYVAVALVVQAYALDSANYLNRRSPRDFVHTG